MRTFLQVEIDGDLKESFKNIAKEKGTDASTLVRTWVKEYVEENSLDKKELSDLLYQAGVRLNNELNASPSHHSIELLDHIKSDESKFIEKVMKMHVQCGLTMPKELLNVKKDNMLAYAFLAGFQNGKAPSDLEE